MSERTVGGTVNTAVETGPGMGGKVVRPDPPDRRGKGVTAMSLSCSGMNRIRKEERHSGDEVRTARNTPLPRAPQRSDPKREPSMRKCTFECTDEARGSGTGDCSGRLEGRPARKRRADPAGIQKPPSGGERVTDAETGWREKIHQDSNPPASTPNSLLRGQGPSFQFAY
jgi:hypothetical protein